MLSEDPSDGELTPDAFSPTQVLVPTSIPILDCVYDGPWLEIHRNLASYVLRAPGVSHSAMYKIGKLSKSWAEWDTFTCLANYHSVLNTLLECLGEKECRSVEASKEVSQDILAILAQMVSIFRDSEAYDAFLTCRGVQAQKLLDFLQDLLDLPLHSNLRPKISKTLVRLCRASKLHPTCFALSGLERVGRQVAGGGFGDIYKGLVGGQHVAVKTMRVFGNVDVEAAEKELGCEAAIWRQLSHPNLLPFYGVYMLKSPIEGVGSEDRRLCLVSPWMDKGDLPHFVRDAPANIDRLSLLVDVAMGLNYLHENGVIHGDLKGPNILVTPSGRACITDFGCSSIAETVSLLFKHSTRTAGGGTARYQAPELLSWENPSPIHPGSDVYAFASLCYEMLTGKLPFFECPNDMAVALAVIEGCRPSRHPTILEALWKLLEECWEKNAEKRPTMPQVIKRLISPSIGASQIQTPTDWDETCSSRFRRSVLPGSFQVTISPPHGLDIFSLENTVHDSPGQLLPTIPITPSSRPASTILSDLNKSIMMKEDAVRLIPDSHPDKPTMLNNLSNLLLGRFEQLGDLSDLNMSIMMTEDAVLLTPDGHPDKPRNLSNLGNSLLGRFERLGDLSDLNKSIMMFEDAVQLTPDGHPDKPAMLNNLGNSLLGRFERLGDLSDLNKSIMMTEDAIQLTPDGHPDKPGRFSNLGNSLFHRFEQLGDLSDLNKSIMMFKDAVQLTPDGHPDKPEMLNNLGNSLLGRFERLGDLSDLNKSIMMLEDAVQLTPDGYPDKPRNLSNLGNSLLGRFERLHDPQDSQQLLLHYTLAVCSATGPASIRFHAARRWAKHAHIHQPSSLLHAYTTAIELLPELAWLGLSITDRHHHLSQAGQVVRDAASAAIAVHDYQKAVEWLDQGRSVILGQLLNLCTPVDELRKIHPGLANQLISLSTSLETAGTRSNAVADTITPQSLQSIAQQSHVLALERNHILQQIRELPGFERFLLSKPISELSLAANRGPVAILNISAYGCDALILMPGLVDEVLHIPLSDFTIHEAQALASLLASIVGTTRRNDRLDAYREGDMAPDGVFSHILSQLWLKIVCPVLNALGITTPASQDLERIWWCPTGPLAFLPIHAAGLYGENQAFGSKLSDFLISSYTPLLTALIEGFRPQPESQEALQLLAVTQPSADGQYYIPGTQKEIECIQKHARGKVHFQWLDERMATIDNVQKGMKNSRWVHFACHGVQSASPTESALLLAGSSQLTLSNMIQLSLPNADLAFLSACQTATGSQQLQDESVHLAAGMLLAGYRGVIGTMWSIMDNDAPQVASDVYAHILEASPPDSTRAAEALHLAVRKLREQPGAEKSFLHWVPFIHFGV